MWKNAEDNKPFYGLRWPNVDNSKSKFRIWNLKLANVGDKQDVTKSTLQPQKKLHLLADAKIKKCDDLKRIWHMRARIVSNLQIRVRVTKIIKIRENKMMWKAFLNYRY